MTKRILIVDDNEDLRSELRSFLEDYEVQEASTGEEALRVLKNAHSIGLVILDVMMPGISGLDVLQELRRTDRSLGVIILTGHSSKDVAIDALRSHADDYIEKPIDIRRLQSAVRRILAVQDGEPDLSSLDLRGRLEQVKRFIEDNRFKKSHLTDAASAVCMSPKYLSRVFKQHIGMGFNEYKLIVKIQASKKLLSKSGYTVNQISEKLGYENAESFIRQFKKLTKTTPSLYRKNLRREKDFRKTRKSGR